MTITKQSVASQIAAYLHHELTLAHLVDWSERALLDGEFAEGDAHGLRGVWPLYWGGGDRPASFGIRHPGPRQPTR